MKKFPFVALLAPLLYLSGCASYYQTETGTAEKVELFSPAQKALEECEGRIQKNTRAIIGPNLVLDGNDYEMLMKLCLANKRVSYQNSLKRKGETAKSLE